MISALNKVFCLLVFWLFFLFLLHFFFNLFIFLHSTITSSWALDEQYDLFRVELAPAKPGAGEREFMNSTNVLETKTNLGEVQRISQTRQK